jgi:hypothetical protein
VHPPAPAPWVMLLQRTGGNAAPGPATAGLPGSSMNSSASEPPALKILLVTLVPRLTVKLAVGTAEPTGVVMVPPVH